MLKVLISDNDPKQLLAYDIAIDELFAEGCEEFSVFYSRSLDREYDRIASINIDVDSRPVSQWLDMEHKFDVVITDLNYAHYPITGDLKTGRDIISRVREAQLECPPVVSLVTAYPGNLTIGEYVDAGKNLRLSGTDIVDISGISNAMEAFKSQLRLKVEEALKNNKGKCCQQVYEFNVAKPYDVVIFLEEDIPELPDMPKKDIGISITRRRSGAVIGFVSKIVGRHVEGKPEMNKETILLWTLMKKFRSDQSILSAFDITSSNKGAIIETEITSAINGLRKKIYSQIDSLTSTGIFLPLEEHICSDAPQIGQYDRHPTFYNNKHPICVSCFLSTYRKRGYRTSAVVDIRKVKSVHDAIADVQKKYINGEI